MNEQATIEPGSVAWESKTADLLKFISRHAHTLSLLYDLDLLPEQLKPDSAEWVKMLRVADAMQSKNELPFEEADLIVKERMIEEVEKLAKREDANMPYIQLDVTKYWSDGIKGKWFAKADIHKDPSIGATIEEALANIPSPITAEEKKAARIAELKAELARLEGAK